MANTVTIANVSFRIVDTNHGPEVSVSTTFGAEISRLTVGEFESFVDSAWDLARVARGRLSAHSRLKNLPLRR